jgi:hypothetical protein
MTPFTQDFISKSILIGEFNVTAGDMRFDTHIRNSNGQIDKDYFVNTLGPIVYIMVCANTDELLKIGMSAGKKCFYGRKNTYNTSSDKTSKKIINYMNSINQNKILVYAIQTPHETIKKIDPKTGKKVLIEVASAPA